MAKLSSILRVVDGVRTSIMGPATEPAPEPLMLAQLGDLLFAVIGPVTGLSSKRAYTYAVHEPIEGKPRLQAIGDELEVLTFTLDFMRELADPVSSYVNLCAAAAAHQVMPLIFADGQVMGRYVITSIEDTVDLTDVLGTVTKRRTRVELTEWVESKPLEVQSRARRAAATTKTAAAPKVVKAPPPVHANPSAVPVAAICRAR